MDKKLLLRSNLATIMESHIGKIDELVQESIQFDTKVKSDGSPVTSLDLALSSLLEQMTAKHFPETTIYSEENYSDWSFPLMAIDPLDGTKEFIKKRPEWAVSVAHILDNEFQGEGWIYNPMTKEKFTNEEPREFLVKDTYRGEVSHSEWDKGLYRNFQSTKFKLYPMGSIAYKLGRLAAGQADFVISLAPKNIWDIAAGVLLSKNLGIKCWSAGEEIKSVKKLYEAPLIFCPPQLLSELSSLFERTDKYL